MTATLRAVKTGTVGAYLTSGDLETVVRVRSQVGRVTVSGKAGLRVLQALAKAGDTSNIDLDPATYLDSEPEQGELFGIDWIARQRDLGLEVIRSEGGFARRNDLPSLKDAFAGRMPDGVSRVVSLSEFWLQSKNVAHVVEAVRGCDEPLSFVLAALFDPLETTESVHSFLAMMEAATIGERRVELLRTDTHAIPFAVRGGAQAAIGLTSSGRHHPQPMNRSTRADFERRQRSAAVWVRSLMGWQQGAKLDAVLPFGGAGLATCGCDPCDGQSLLRFTREWNAVPKAVRAEAQAHDVASWTALRDEVLRASDPVTAWAQACAAAQRVEAELLSRHKISALKAPRSLREWV